MSPEKKLVIGMPAGSLADPNRGGSLNTLLKNAGFATQGYDKGGPTTFPGFTCLFGWDGRPQEFGSQLDLGELDIAITGDDWVAERRLEMEIEHGRSFDLERILPLDRGKVRIVGITADQETPTTAAILEKILSDKGIVTVATELPYLALQWLRDTLAGAGMAEAYPEYSVQKYRTPPRIERGILIYESWGKTEAKLTNGGSDLGVEITQSGSAIRGYGLRILDEIMTSESAVYMNRRVREDEEKLELARMFLMNLCGAVNAEDKVMVIFDVPRSDTATIETYLQTHRLYADEPSKTEGDQFVQYSVQMRTDDPVIPIARARYELARLGARSINTMPLTSSVSGVRCVDL